MRLVHSEIDPMHDAGDKAGRKPDCAEDIARTPEFVGGIPSGGDLGDDTLDHRAGDGPGRCRLPPIGYSPRAAPGPRRSNARSRSRACTATPPLVLPRRAGTWSREVWMPRLHDRQRKGATTDVVAMRRDRQARAVCRIYELPAAEVADLRSAYESGDPSFLSGRCLCNICPCPESARLRYSSRRISGRGRSTGDRQHLEADNRTHPGEGSDQGTRR